jgi:ATP-dependent RNA helicase DDX54/DBP10
MSLASVSFVVFDEADRLFELGFDTALTEILSKLPNTRQTLLFSATLPKSLVEFAKAGLKDPKLVRLDKEGKMSEELRMCFWSVKENEKDAALLGLLRDVIGVPFKKDQRLEQAEKGNTKKKNARAAGGAILLLPHQTLVFTATKHHVEYISHLLSLAGYAVSYIYGTLDQAARSHQLSLFLAAKTSVLVVTDIAARGIDIPVLENVINYDFPVGARVFVHRVGRTARMGRKGWAWSFVGPQDLPYLIDLQLFLGKPLVNRLSISSDSSTGINESAFVSNMLLSPLPRDVLDQDLEYIHQTLDGTNFELVQMRRVMERGQKMYDRSKGKASAKSYSRAKEMTKDPRWGFTGTTIQDGQGGMVYSVLQKQRKPRESRVIGQGSNGSSGNEDFIQEEARLQKEAEVESQRSSLLLSIARFQPSETVFELGSRGKTPGAQLMKGRRKALGKAQERSVKTTPREAEDSHDVAMDESGISGEVIDVEMADEQDIQVRPLCLSVSIELIELPRMCSVNLLVAVIEKRASGMKNSIYHITIKMPRPTEGEHPFY